MMRFLHEYCDSIKASVHREGYFFKSFFLSINVRPLKLDVKKEVHMVVRLPVCGLVVLSL